MVNYIDGFVFPIKKKHLDQYKSVVGTVAEIWKEYGALAYKEFIGDDMYLEGTKSFHKEINATEDEVIVFGWVEFDSLKTRNKVNELVANDPRMEELIAPLVAEPNKIFDAQRMLYGGFKSIFNGQ